MGQPAGSLALGFAGAVAGFFIGGPLGGAAGAQFGAALGWAGGSLLGNALFPGPAQQGPKLSDLRMHGSTYGAPLPIIYGTVRLGGNDVWETDLEPHENTSGGKGGPEVTTTSYTGTWRTGICDNNYKNPVFTNVYLGRQWANSRVVADNRPDATLESGNVPYTYYDGNPAQLPSALEEGIIGAGLVPAYRRMASVLYDSWDLSEFGNAEPSLNFEVSTKCFDTVQSGFRSYRVLEFGSSHTPYPIDDEYPMAAPTHGGYMVTLTVRDSDDNPVEDICTRPTVVKFRGVNCIPLEPGVPTVIPAGKAACFELLPGYVPPVGTTIGFWVTVQGRHYELTLGIEGAVEPPADTFPAVWWWMCNHASLPDIIVPDNRVGTELKWTSPQNDSFYFMYTYGAVVGEQDAQFLYTLFDDWWYDSERYYHTLLTGTAGAGWTSIEVSGPPGNPLYFPTLDHTESSVTDSCPATLLSDVVLDILLRVGLTTDQIDVTRIPFPVRGITLDSNMTARAALEAILPVYGVRAVESDGKIKFVPDGLPALPSIPVGKLCAHIEDQELPARLQSTRDDDREIPWQITLNFPDVGMDYQPNAVIAERLGTGSEATTVVSVPVYMTVKEAKQVAQAWLDHLWTARDKHTFYTTREYAHMEPTDVVPINGIMIRIAEKRELANGSVIEWRGETALPGIFAQPGVGGEAFGFTGQTIPVEQETELAILDIPLIADVNRQAVIHAGMQGALRRSWRGASLQKSIDGGSSYSEVLVNRNPDTMGVTLTKLSNYGGPSFDESSVLRVRLGPGAGELSSSTRDSVLAGAKRAMVGAEMIGYVNADLVGIDDYGRRTYDVYSLLRGVNGTEWAMKGHAVGDLFCALPTNTVMDALRTDYGRTRLYKAPTLGRTLASATAVEFRSNGVSLAAYAPVNVAAGLIDDDSFLLRWDRRSRLGFGWLPGVPLPLGEEVEQYRIRIYEDGSKQTIVNTYYADTTEFEYTSAMQTADFGGVLESPPAWNVAQKCALGWGYDSDGQLPTLLPEDFPGYVPPNPSPFDATRAVRSTMPFVNGSIRQALGLTPDQIWIIAVTVGSTPTAINDYVNIAAEEYTGAPIPRIWVFSPIPGDFRPQPRRGAYQLEGSPFVSATFQVIDDNDSFFPVVPTGETWYLSIKTLATSYESAPMQAQIGGVP